MTVTLNALSLNVLNVKYTPELINSVTDKWSGGTYGQVVTVYGRVERWSLTCDEYNVTWANSSAKSLSDTSKLGTKVNLTMTEPPHTANLNVYIVKVEAEYEPGAPDHRIFTVEVQEAAL